MGYYDCMVLAAFGAAFEDVFWGKVDNRWVVTCALSGTFVHVLRNGLGGLVAAALGCFLPFLLLFLLFQWRMLGAGDIKVFCALGTFLGPAGILRCLAAAFLVGGIFSMAVLFRTHTFWRRFAHLFRYFRMAFGTGIMPPYREEGQKEGSFPFVLSILVGSLWVYGGILA